MDDVYQQTVTDIRNGVRFAGWLLVKEATVRQTASGKSFLDMRLVDCTGVVPGKFWDYVGDAPAVGTVVYVEGLGNLYNGHLQLRIDSFRAAVPEDGKQASDFIPSAPETPESMLEEILSCARALRDELYDAGVRVTAVFPGAVDTPFYRLDAAWRRRRVRWGVMSTPREVAKKGLRALFRGRSRCIPGLFTKTCVFLCRLLPPAVIRAILRLKAVQRLL